MAERNQTLPVPHSLSLPESAGVPDSDEDPPLPTVASSGNIEKKEVIDPDVSRQSKRRKNCPKALDNIEEFVPSNQSFSFTFDTQLSGFCSEFTPKFGSFNQAKDRPCQIPLKILESKEESESRKEREREREIVGVLRIVDEIEEVE
ncbi:Soluble starch synthase [Quillaja saponaria]|uniref:Soluble starch synthase n=1 Tax=Quillaja saponaria TaxID=32244 RepID=A0AAD7VHX9_QUISA|nr:Soluble starch synthase [Quillaja saponaria]